jgi:hypothetical protein
MSTRRSGWRPRRSDADFHDEIDAHITLEAERLIAEGVDPVEARAAARRAFGNVAAAEERFYEASRWLWLEQLRQDVRYAVRTLWRSRAFVATTVLTLAIALGLVTVLFAVFNAYVLRPFAIPDPSRVFQLAWRLPPDDGSATFTWREYTDLRRRSVSGLYGLLTYVLSQRTREIGIRMALGATAAAVVRLIVRQSARVVGIGALIGLLFTYAALRLLEAVMPNGLGNISIFDAWAFVAGIAMIAGAALVASYFPARRATHVDPCTSLRAE